MGAFLVSLDMFLQQGEGMIVRRYGKKHGDGGMFFNSIICLFSLIFFILTDKNGLVFPKKLFLYGLISCIMFAIGFYAMYVALQYGSYVSTKLISSFSGVISIVYGITFLKEPAGFNTYLGIILVFFSVFLMRYKKKSERDKNDKGFSLKWLLYVLASAISNGFISVISRMQQIRFENSYDNEFMILSFGGVFIALFILGIIKERENFRYIAKYGTLYGIGAGFFNGSKNLVNLAIYLYIPISVATPVKTGLGFILNFIISVFLYKEKFTKQQLISVLLGIVALILFKL